MDTQQRKNLRKAADFCRELRRDELAEACSRASDEIDLLRDELAAALGMLMRLTAIAVDANERFFERPPRAGSSERP